MKILITGGSGLLGKSLLETALKDHKITSTYNKNWQKTTEQVIWYQLDIRNRSNIFEVFDRVKPNIVIHCASIGSVDYTEDHYHEVRQVNVTGLSHVIDAANGCKTKMVYISTNAVYSGKSPPYNENSPLEPINSYGIIKREAERLVRDIANKWLIIRPFLLYGWPYPGGRTNWAVNIIQSLTNSQKGLKLVNDIIWMPTYAPDCAEAIWKLLFQIELDRGIFNVAAPERATLYEFGLKVCDVFSLEKNLLRPVDTEYFFNIAKRPKDTTYDLIKLSGEGIILSDIKTGLERMKEAQE
jgi:dTDP-4-dehydrorhamnose reductase